MDKYEQSWKQCQPKTDNLMEMEREMNRLGDQTPSGGSPQLSVLALLVVILVAIGIVAIGTLALIKHNADRIDGITAPAPPVGNIKA